MIEFTRLRYIKEKTDFIQKQIEQTIAKAKDCKLTIDTGENEETERKRIVDVLDKYHKEIPLVYEEVKEFNTREALENVTTDVFLNKLIKVEKILNSLKKDVGDIAYKHYSARLDPYEREIKKNIAELYDEFDFILPSIRYEIELIEGYFKDPENSERTIVPELLELVGLLEKKLIGLEDFLHGCNYKGTDYVGYITLRTSEGIFSQFQYYESLSVQYDAINNAVYNMCKSLEPFIVEQRAEAEFSALAERFETIKMRTESRKVKRNITCMSDVFHVYGAFNQILKKIEKKFSFRDEYRRTSKIFQEFIEEKSKLIVYNIDAIKEEEKKCIESIEEEANKNKFNLIMKEVKDHIQKKNLSFDKLESVFKQLWEKDFNVVIVEKEADELSINITPPIAEKYGEANLRRINILITEIDHWFHGKEKLERFERVSVFTDKIQAQEEVVMKDLVKAIKLLDNEIESLFRKDYALITKDLSNVIGNCEKFMADKKQREAIEDRLMEKEAWAFYSPRLLVAKKNVLILSSDTPALRAGNINKFPFIKTAASTSCQLLYELGMRVFSCYENVDRRSITHMMTILSIFKEYNEFVSLWMTYQTLAKTKNVSNFATLEEKVKRFSKNPAVVKKIAEAFPK